MKKRVLIVTSLMAMFVATEATASFNLSSSGLTDKSEAVHYINVGDNKYQYVFTSGRQTGSYYPAAEKIVNQLPEAINIETDGSLQNFDMITSDFKGYKANMAFMQSDILSYECSKNPTVCKDLRVIPTNKKELITMVCRPDVKIGGDKTITVDVGSANSGASGSLNNIMRLDKRLKFKKTWSAFGKISNSTVNEMQNKKLDCFAMTTSHPLNDIVKYAIKKGMEIKDIKGKNFDGEVNLGGEKMRLYNYSYINWKDKDSWFGTKTKTLATNLIMVVNIKRMTVSQFNKVLKVLDRLTVNGRGLF